MVLSNKTRPYRGRGARAWNGGLHHKKGSLFMVEKGTSKKNGGSIDRDHA